MITIKKNIYIQLTPSHNADYNTETRPHRLNRKFHEKIQEIFSEGYRSG